MDNVSIGFIAVFISVASYLFTKFVHLVRVRDEVREEINPLRSKIDKMEVQLNAIWPVFQKHLLTLIASQTHPTFKALLPKLADGTITINELREIEAVREMLLCSPDQTLEYKTLLQLMLPAITVRYHELKRSQGA